MPELPEVETIKRDLEQKILGLSIKDVDVYDPRVIYSLSQKEFIRKLKNRKVKSLQRRAKAVIVCFERGAYLVIQVKMTGHLIYGGHLRKDRDLKDTKVVFHLSNGKYLNYNDQRLFGRLIFTEDLNKIAYLKNAGPEPLNGTFTPDWLTAELGRRSSPIKPLLMNQSFLAGIGNIYASEILYAAGISPVRPSNRLSPEEIRALHKTTIDVLKRAIRLRGTSMRNYRDSDGKKGNFLNRIKVYGREKQACGLCFSPIQKITQVGRSTFFCAKCQK